MPETLVEFKGIGKCFGANRVLEDVSFDLRAGEVHILAGENGAGKSTLIKILAGIHTDYEGGITVRGRPVRFSGPHDANRMGISVIHQEMSLVESMSVSDNIHLGRESARFGNLWLDRGAQTRRTLDLCRELDLELSAADLERPVEQFPLSAKTRMEIAKALVFDARILVMDEPTSALNRSEVEKLFTLIRAVRGRGCGIIYITHRMEEIYRVADRITVLRDGKWVGTAESGDCPESRLIQWMIGRDLSGQSRSAAPQTRADGAPPALEIAGLRVPHPIRGRPDAISDFSVAVRAGEIVGIAGLQGSGSSELFQAIFGAYGAVCEGSLSIGGRAFRPESPAKSIGRGVAYLTADRKGTGLVLGMSVGDNISLASLPRTSPGGLLRPRQERLRAERQAKALQIRLASLDQPAGTLSGGNQQKVVLAKWLETQPAVLLLDEPTRGVDIGAKQEIYSLMNQWTRLGMAILLVSTELPELLLLSDRVLALHRGRVTAEFSRAEATPGNIMAAAMGFPGGNAKAVA
jgi:ABC-type sugar transport system ATPase subunit